MSAVGQWPGNERLCVVWATLVGLEGWRAGHSGTGGLINILTTNSLTASHTYLPYLVPPEYTSLLYLTVTTMTLASAESLFTPREKSLETLKTLMPLDKFRRFVILFLREKIEIIQPSYH